MTYTDILILIAAVAQIIAAFAEILELLHSAP